MAEEVVVPDVGFGKEEGGEGILGAARREGEEGTGHWRGIGGTIEADEGRGAETGSVEPVL